MLDLDAIRKLLDTSYGLGADKWALHGHIEAYEKAVPPVLAEMDRLTAELATAQAELKAYRRIPVPVAPQVIRLHQAWEGTTVCLHCGAPMPWEGMEVCPGAQAERAPVEWKEGTDYRGEAFWTCIRRPLMLRVQRSGWDLVAIYEESYHELDSGPETGPEGKDKCEAAYRRAAGL